MFNMKKILFALMAMMGVLVFTGCSNDDQLGVDNLRKYESSFVQTFGKVNPNQDFNTQRAVGIDVSVSNTQGNYTLRVFSAMPNTKGAKLLGKFENLNAGQVSTVSVDAHKAAKNIYCMVDDGVHNCTKAVAIPSAGKADVKFDGIASARNASTRADGDGDLVDIKIDDDMFNPNAVTIAFEDLGASDDFDFNDAVIMVEYVSGTGKLKVTLMAVGAVLPLRLYCLSEDMRPMVATRPIDEYFDLVPLFDGKELHEVMGQSQNTMINTNWKGSGSTVGKDNVDFVTCEIDAPYFLSLSRNGFPFILEVDGQSGEQYRITNNDEGAIPQVMVIGDYYAREITPQVATRSLSDGDWYYIPWRWSKERVSIQEAYTTINNWVEVDPYDYSFLFNGVVDDNLYDGYNPLAEYDDEGAIELQAVDLDLPSGTLWANMNVGASAPEQAGGYYAWGEIEEKTSYDWDSYLYDGADGHLSYLNLGDIRGTQYDVAHNEQGGDWVMPTVEQFQELINNCEMVYGTRKGMPGVKFIGQNGNSIFIPLPGYYENDNLNLFGSIGYYWTSTFEEKYNGAGLGPCTFTIEYGSYFADDPFYGQPVRAVINQSQTPAGLEAVDLGLPSGTKWANMNVGATAPEEYGGYYAWGETEEKDWYDETTYAYYKDDNYIYIGDDIAGTEYDVAHVKWGGDWVMPTKDQVRELVDNTTSEWTQVNGVNGRKFTSKATGNSNSIFVPNSGHRWGGNLIYAGRYGYCWSSALDPWFPSDACALYIDSGPLAVWYDYGRYYGQNVRPVICGE